MSDLNLFFNSILCMNIGVEFKYSMEFNYELYGAEREESERGLIRMRELVRIRGSCLS